MNTRKGQKGFVFVDVLARISKNRLASSCGCHLWTGAKDQHGYGTIWFCGRRHRVTRVVYWLTNGTPPPPWLDVCHTCDNPSCINPAHLWAGTKSQNALDSVAKNRHNMVSKTKCKHGHEFTPENTLNRKHVRTRICRACAKIRKEAMMAKFGSQKEYRKHLAARAALGKGAA